MSFRWITVGWPGLARAWATGESRALISSLVFAVVLNFALLVTFIWPDLLRGWLPTWSVWGLSWLAVLWFWVAGVTDGLAYWEAEDKAFREPDAASNQRLRSAQTAYLRGHYVEAESHLCDLLRIRPQDVEARLLLASVLRRTGRGSAATEQLQLLEQQELANRWWHEIAREKKRITETAEVSTTEPEIIPLRKAA